MSNLDNFGDAVGGNRNPFAENDQGQEAHAPNQVGALKAQERIVNGQADGEDHLDGRQGVPDVKDLAAAVLEAKGNSEVDEGNHEVQNYHKDELQLGRLVSADMEDDASVFAGEA